MEKKYKNQVLAALILSLLSVFGLGLFGYIGLVIGWQTNRKIEKGNKYKKLAIVAIILGAIFGPIKSVIGLLARAGY